MMDEFQKELLKAIQEIAMTTGMTTKECIKQGIEMLKKQRKKVEAK